MAQDFTGQVAIVTGVRDGIGVPLPVNGGKAAQLTIPS